MIIYTQETVFNTDADCIVNTVNCVGNMGKGLALEYSLRYPELYRIYKEQCANRQLRTGRVYYYEINGKKIINFPTKFHFMYPSRIEWIEAGLIDFISKYRLYNIKSVAFPLLGCSNGGLDQNEVIKLMEKHLNVNDLDVYICFSTKLNGKEKEMLDGFKKIDIEDLSKQVKLNKIQKYNLFHKRDKINRFYQILDIDKIGTKTYGKIFSFFYNNANYYKMNLFDLINSNE